MGMMLRRHSRKGASVTKLDEKPYKQDAKKTIVTKPVTTTLTKKKH
jgi:hypothetical protein